MAVNYEIQTEWGGRDWHIRLTRTKNSFWSSYENYTIIKSDIAKSEKERDNIVNDFKINKTKYINAYECNERKNQKIPI